MVACYLAQEIVTFIKAGLQARVLPMQWALDLYPVKYDADAQVLSCAGDHEGSHAADLQAHVLQRLHRRVVRALQPVSHLPRGS